MLISIMSREYNEFNGCKRRKSATMASFHIKSYDPSVLIEKILATKILSKEKIKIKANELIKYEEALTNVWKNKFKLAIFIAWINNDLSNFKQTIIGLIKMLILAITIAQA